MVKYNGNEITEHEAIKKICEGVKLDAFEDSTLLMRFATVVHHKEGYREIKDGTWTRLLSIYAVERDFEALRTVPVPYRVHCVTEYASFINKLSRETLDKWVEILNEQEETFIKKVLRIRPVASKYVNKTFTGKDDMVKAAISNIYSDPQKIEMPDNMGFLDQDFEDILDDLEEDTDDVRTVDSFFSKPVAERTKEELMLFINSKDRLPNNFIKRLIQPLRNEYTYRQQGDDKKADMFKTEILPYVNKELCLMIAEKHPEASIETPSFLTEEAVHRFMKEIKESGSDKKTRYFFNAFPEKFLTKEMLGDIVIDFNTLNHAPDVLYDSEPANKFLNRYPFRVMELPEQYQTEERILKQTVVLNESTIRQIKNKEMRENVRLALNIGKKKK